MVLLKWFSFQKAYMCLKSLKCVNCIFLFFADGVKAQTDPTELAQGAVYDSDQL